MSRSGNRLCAAVTFMKTSSKLGILRFQEGLSALMLITKCEL